MLWCRFGRVAFGAEPCRRLCARNPVNCAVSRAAGPAACRRASFQGHSMTVDFYAYCPAAYAVLVVLNPTLIQTERVGARCRAARCGIRQEAGR
ncbi:hypothetical protein BLAT2472_50294 [Burkholderia latens]